MPVVRSHIGEGDSYFDDDRFSGLYFDASEDLEYDILDLAGRTVAPVYDILASPRTAVRRMLDPGYRIRNVVLDVLSGAKYGMVLEYLMAKATGAGPGINSPLTDPVGDLSGNLPHEGDLVGFAGTTASGYAGAGTAGDPYRLVFPTHAENASSAYVDAGDVGAIEDNSFSFEVWCSTSATGLGALTAIGEFGSGGSAALQVQTDGTVDCYIATATGLVMTLNGETAVYDGEATEG